MKRVLLTTLIFTLLLMSATTASAEPPTTSLRFFHAVPNGPTVNVLINGQLALSDISFTEASDYISLTGQSHTIQLVSSDNPDNFLFETIIDTEAEQIYTLVVTGKVAMMEALVIEDNHTLPAAGHAQIRFVHLSPNAPTLDVLAKNGLEANLFSDIGFKGAARYVPLKAGEYDFTLKVSGTSVIAFSSSPITLEADTVYSLFAVGLAGGEPGLQVVPQVEAPLPTATELIVPPTEEPAVTAADESPNAEETPEETTTVTPAKETPIEAAATMTEQDTPATPVKMTRLTPAELLAQNNIEVKTHQLIPQDIAPETMPMTGDEGQYPVFVEIAPAALLADSQPAAPTTTEPAQMALTPHSTMPLLLSLVVLVSSVILGIRAIPRPDPLNVAPQPRPGRQRETEYVKK